MGPEMRPDKEVDNHTTSSVEGTGREDGNMEEVGEKGVRRGTGSAAAPVGARCASPAATAGGRRRWCERGGDGGSAVCERGGEI
jgi:hypothetical protein